MSVECNTGLTLTRLNESVPVIDRYWYPSPLGFAINDATSDDEIYLPDTLGIRVLFFTQ
jgi:hypothetical protein